MGTLPGCIADDITGATDLAGMLVRTVQMIGVPWTLTLNAPQLALARKSGNFGTPHFFLKAWELLP